VGGGDHKMLWLEGISGYRAQGGQRSHAEARRRGEGEYVVRCRMIEVWNG
jgi:hypothetical protein